MKIVAHSNFDDETMNEWLVAESIPSTVLANIMVRALQASVGEHDPYYYKIVPASYVLYKWEP